MHTATGCADITTPAEAIVTRTDTEATVSCKYTDQQWKLNCRGVHWMGKIGNCTKPGTRLIDSYNYFINPLYFSGPARNCESQSNSSSRR